MNNEEIKAQLKEYLPDYVGMITYKSKGNNYICPLCGSGRGKNKTGAFSINGNSWKCFSCDAGGDIFDLVGKVEGLTDYNQQLDRLKNLFNIKTSSTSSKFKYSESWQKLQPSAAEPEETLENFFTESHKNISKTDYWERRGISRAVADLFNLGYVEQWKHPKAPDTAPLTPRLIIPTGKSSYLARDTRETIPEQQKSYSKQKVGKLEIFNIEAIKKADRPIFIVEGEIDALSIIEAGGIAIAIGTTTKAKELVEVLRAEPPAQPLIIALDNDAAGEKASAIIEEGLTAASIKYYKADISKPFKDPNEALVKDRDSFIMAVKVAEELPELEEKKKREEYKQNAVVYSIEKFWKQCIDNADKEVVKTGFSNLDEALEGGLYEGLYIVGAISSLGKTTLITQITDQIAETGKDVIIFSLEMAKSEIMAKSVSRETLKLALEENSINHAKTTRGITDGTRWKKYSEKELNLIRSAMYNYGNYAHNIYIYEGIGDIGVKKIREKIQEHIHYTGEAPVVIIDYLQILAPYNEKYTDKQNTDKAVTELKRISRDFNIPVIAISSFNRANYKEAVTMEAFKESGAIEYSSDVLIGLQLKGAGEKDFDVNEAKSKTPREVEVVILKNRNGRTGVKAHFNYYALFNYFEQVEE